MLRHFPQQEIGSAARSLTRHTRFVVFSKHIVLLLVLALVTGIILVPLLRQEDAGIRVAFSSVEKAGSAILPRMINPRLRGVDGDNNPFLLAAEEGIQPSEGRVELYRLKADMTLEGDDWLALDARKAEVDMLSKQMVLEGDISIFHGGGYELHTQKAYVNMEEASAHGDVEITGQGPAGVLKAGGFRMYKESERLQFINGVRLIIYPKVAQ